MFGSQPKTGVGRKKKEADEQRNGLEEVDFIDEKELKGALQLGVLKTSDDVASEVGHRNGMDLDVDEELINQVAAIVWDTVADSWAEDLARFTKHAGRAKVSMDDVALLTRRNPELLQAACKMAGITNSEENATKSAKGRKRKNQETPIPAKPPRKTSDDEITIIDAKTPKMEAKKSKIFSENSEFSTKAPMTSTPKISEKTLKFPAEITPIRPNNEEILEKTSKISNLTAIPEEENSRNPENEEEEDQDSFDVFGNSSGTKTIPNNTESLLRQAENFHASSIIEPKDRLESERLEQMVPEDEEFENASVDSFDKFEQAPPTTTKMTEKSEEIPKNSVFSKKMSSFAFDDSFDDEIQEIPIPSTSSKIQKPSAAEAPPTSSLKKPKNKTLQLERDSFDEFDFDI